jgi:hypothetical protein
VRRACILALALAATLAAAGQPVPFQVFDWLPGTDAALHQKITDFFHLDPARLPRTRPAGSGGLILENPGGAPTAGMFTPVSLDPGLWTLRFQARWLGDPPAPRAGASLLTGRLDFVLHRDWRQEGLTVPVPEALGPGSLGFSLRSRQGAMEVGQVELVRLPFEARVCLQGQRLTLALQGRLPQESLQVELHSIPLLQWSRPPLTGRLLVPWNPGRPSPTPSPAAPGWIQELPAGNTRQSWRASFPYRPLPEPFLLRWRLLDGQGRVVHGGGQLRVGEPAPPPRAAPPRDVRLDSRGVLHVEGRPFFPTGLYLQECSEEALASARLLGVNTVVMGAGPDCEGLVARARAAGLEVILGASPESAQAARAFVEAHRHLPILAWSLVDEPDLRPDLHPRVPELYEAVAGCDGRPVYTSNHSPSSFLSLAPYTDILAIDPYPLGTVPQPLSTVAAWTEEAAASLPPGRPVWYINQSFAMAPFWNRPPSPAQLRAMTWLALARGARGLMFYSLRDVLYPGNPEHRWDLLRSDLAEEVRRECAEVAELAPYLWGEARPLPAAGGLQAARFQAPQGGLLVLVNPSPAPLRSAVFLGTEVETAWLYPEGTAVALAQGALAVELPPYGVALFLLPATGQDSLRAAARESRTP